MFAGLNIHCTFLNFCRYSLAYTSISMLLLDLFVSVAYERKHNVKELLKFTSVALK
ncbi:hypothetical protein BSG8_36180 [Bacillus subtilis subsp. natto]|nr:hypothetical protein BSG8_36180 [Bacillus subtilis subsp. natto]